MSIREVGTFARHYALIGLTLALTWLLSSRFTDAIDRRILEAGEGTAMLLVLFSIVIIFTLGFLIYELAKPTALPSFVLAIFFGVVARDILAFLVESPVSLSTLITIGAVLILFGGGLETPFTKFRSLLAPILMLAIPGTLITAFLLSLLLINIGENVGVELPLAAAVLLGAALASTDPAAIIPSFRSLLFKQPRVKHIAISESAINDVVGAVLVTIFLGLFTSAALPKSVFAAYGQLLTLENLYMIARVVLVGAITGILGFLVLHLWGNWKSKVYAEEGSDAALFLGVPLTAFTIASIFGGSGYLAVFLSGLFFHIRAHFRHVEHYFNHTIEGFMKPIIFMLLGAMVDPSALMSVAPLGIGTGLLFMFVLRPLTVFLTIGAFAFTRQKMMMRELLFLSFVRETGVIPAALLITIRLAGIPGSDLLVAVGLWIILLTLVIEPPLTPFVAKKLGVAVDCDAGPVRRHAGPVAVLCSRGMSFPIRMQTVVDWAEQHGVENVALLHCPEERYSPSFIHDVRKKAEELFVAINHRLSGDGKKELNFEFLSGKGLLQENIERMVDEGDVSIIFVGAKMLDYRLDDVKRLNVPFFFMP